MRAYRVAASISELTSNLERVSAEVGESRFWEYKYKFHAGREPVVPKPFAIAGHTYLLPLTVGGSAGADPRRVISAPNRVAGVDWTPDGRDFVFQIFLALKA